jgi:hypothetical protein
MEEFFGMKNFKVQEFPSMAPRRGGVVSAGRPTRSRVFLVVFLVRAKILLREIKRGRIFWFIEIPQDSL